MFEKIKMFFVLTFVLSFFISPTPSFAAFGSSSAGTSAAQFLKIGVGARAVAMGEAYGAVADDVTALYWNPAGLGRLTRKNFSATNITWLKNVSYNFIAYAHPLGRNVFALGLNQLAVPSTDKYNKNGELTGQYTAGDTAINLGYASTLSKDISIGLNLKSVQSNIDGTSAGAFTADIGLLYTEGTHSFCAAVQNLGSKVQFVKQSDPLPLNIKIGAAYRLMPEKLLLALDVNAPSDNEIKLNLGTEYVFKFSNAFSLAGRFGVRTNVKGLDPLSAVSYGIGIKWTMIDFDFAFVPYGDLGSTMRTSLGLKFGASPAPASASTQPSNLPVTTKPTPVKK